LNGADLRGVAAGRQLEDKAGRVVDQVEQSERAGGRGERALGQVVEAVAHVHHDPGRIAEPEQIQFVGLAGLGEAPDGVGEGDLLAFDGISCATNARIRSRMAATWSARMPGRFLPFAARSSKLQ